MGKYIKGEEDMIPEGVVLFDKSGQQVTEGDLIVRARAVGLEPSDLIGKIWAPTHDALIEAEAHFSR